MAAPVTIVHGGGTALTDAARALGDGFTVNLLPAAELRELPADGPCVIELGALDEQARARVHDQRPDGRGLIVAGGRELKAHLPDLFENHRLRHLLRCDQSVEARDFSCTLAQLAAAVRFGYRQYLGELKHSTRLEITRASEKRDVVNEASAFATRCQVGSRFVTAFSTLADELVTNAIYNAPTDEAGAARYAHLARDVEVQLSPTEKVVVELGYDGQRLAMSVTDAFGSLGVRHLQLTLARCLKRGEDQVSYKPGGAGLGLFYSLQLVSHLVLNITPRVVTEAIGLIDTRPNYREFSSHSKSLNIFTTAPTTDSR